MQPRKFGSAGNSLVQPKIWFSRKFIGSAGNLFQPNIRDHELGFSVCEKYNDPKFFFCSIYKKALAPKRKKQKTSGDQSQSLHLYERWDVDMLLNIKELLHKMCDNST
jgi:hypothetical protein